jgi:antitoxin ParD1/3/4
MYGGDDKEASIATIKRLTITLPADMAGLVKGAVDDGDYASTSEVVREALRDWKLKRELRLHQLAELKADIDRGLADVAQGRLANFDAQRIIARGRKLSADRSTSASPKQRKET